MMQGLNTLGGAITQNLNAPGPGFFDTIVIRPPTAPTRPRPIVVQWPASHVVEFAPIWRVLDLSGITSSVRESKNFTKMGLVYLNGNLAKQDTLVRIGNLFTLEVRLPNGMSMSRHILLVHRPYHRKPRSI